MYDHGIDFRQVLLLYIRQVLAAEGITFVDRRNHYNDFPVFTDEQYAALCEVEVEALKRD